MKFDCDDLDVVSWEFPSFGLACRFAQETWDNNQCEDYQVTGNIVLLKNPTQFDVIMERYSRLTEDE